MKENFNKIAVLGAVGAILVLVMPIVGGVAGTISVIKAYTKAVEKRIFKKDQTNENPENEGNEPEAIA